jgi:hypothetical protein
MKIDRNNYEIRMIDYFDGKLNAAEKAELMAFIEKNPDIKSEFEQFEPVIFEPEEIKFPAKKDLKKAPIKATENIIEDNYETFFLDYYENDLDENRRKEVLEFVAANPALKDEFEFHGRLFANADTETVYAYKSGLKKKPVIPVYLTIASAAAAIVILFGLFQLMKTENPEIKPDNMRQLSINAMERTSINVNLGSITNVQILNQSLKKVDYPAISNQNIRDEQLAVQPIKSLEANLRISQVNYPVVIRIPQTEFYDPDLLLAEVYSADRKSAFGRIIQNFARRLTGNTPVENKEVERNDEPKFVNALGKGISVFNTLTGSNTELVKTYNKDGKITGYFVEGESIAFHHEINKPKTVE